MKIETANPAFHQCRNKFSFQGRENKPARPSNTPAGVKTSNTNRCGSLRASPSQAGSDKPGYPNRRYTTKNEFPYSCHKFVAWRYQSRAGTMTASAYSHNKGRRKKPQPKRRCAKKTSGTPKYTAGGLMRIARLAAKVLRRNEGRCSVSVHETKK